MDALKTAIKNAVRHGNPNTLQKFLDVLGPDFVETYAMGQSGFIDELIGDALRLGHKDIA